MLIAAVGVGALALLFGSLVSLARGDGDPASDVLATQQLFLPQDAGVAPAQQVQLGALLSEAQRSGDPVRVAVIASAADLGSVTELWRQPEDYARFLGQELSLSYRGLLLVVMPDGYGLFRPNGPSARERSVLAGAAGPGNDLGSAAIAAVRRLAASSGHALALPRAASASRAGSGDAISWIVFALGAALIALAWSASVRVRPVGG